MLDSTRLLMCSLANCGFSGKAIAAKALKYTGENYSTGHIYSTIRKAGIRIKDYRDGEGPQAERMFRSVLRGRQPASGLIHHSGQRNTTRG